MAYNFHIFLIVDGAIVVRATVYILENTNLKLSMIFLLNFNEGKLCHIVI